MFLFAKKAFTVRLMLNLVAAAEESSTGVSSGTGLSVLETGARLRPELYEAHDVHMIKHHDNLVSYMYSLAEK